MNQIEAYRILQDQGFTADNANGFLKAIAPDTKDLATKADVADVRHEIKDLRIEMKEMHVKLLETINGQTWKLFGGLTLIATLLKLADMMIK